MIIIYMHENENKIIECEVKISRIFFPKNNLPIKSGDFMIAKVEVISNISNTYVGETISIKGHSCEIDYRSTYKLRAELLETNQYGETYNILYINKAFNLTNKDEQRVFLSAIIKKEELLEDLLNNFDNVIDLLESRDIESLTKIKGIGVHRAEKLINSYFETKDYSEIFIELDHLKLTGNMIRKLIDYYKSPEIIIKVIKESPYDLVKIEGIGFKTADEIALNMSVGLESVMRIKAFLIHILTEKAEEGKSYLYFYDLISLLHEALGFISNEKLEEVAEEMIRNNDIVLLDNGDKICLKKYYDLEQNIYDELVRIRDVPNILNKDNMDDWEETIKLTEDSQGFEFTSEQREAVELILDENVIAITGGAGVGKTSTTKGIYELFKNTEVLACALAGKAAIRITEAIGLNACTIHRGLGYNRMGFLYNKNNQLKVDVVIIDESTMINGSLFYSLLQAIPSGAKVIVVGDIQQLTPIGNCQVFSDILSSGVMPTIRLSIAHRQAQKSGIFIFSNSVAKQEQIITNDFIGKTILGENQDMVLDLHDTKLDLSDKVVDYFLQQLDEHQDILEVQIITSMKLRGNLSCYNLNAKVKSKINPFDETKDYIEISLTKKGENYKFYPLQVGDKVINMKNNYEVVDIDDKPCAVFNGNIGVILEIDKVEDICIVDFIGIGKVVLNKTAYMNLQLAYAITTHKSQGSEFLSVITCLDSSSYRMNTNELLYTACSRAKIHCVLVGDIKAVKNSINNKSMYLKQTRLASLLQIQ